MHENIESAVEHIIKAIGEDLNRDGLKDTPRRAAKAYANIFNGYSRSLKDEITLFKNEQNYSGIIYSGRISFFSVCEHHLLPFHGSAYIAYIPDREIIGLSKLSRAVDIYARRLQDQERITMQVSTELEKLLSPRGIAVMIKSQHLCNMARGVEQVNSNMKTLQFRGDFLQNEGLQNQFFNLLDED